MFLACVIYECEDKLIGDLAEYYGVYDYKSLPPSLVASLTVALRPESRVMMHLSKSKLTMDQTLKVLMVDNLRILVWQKTKSGQKGRRRPKALLEQILGKQKKNKDELEKFSSIEAFERWRLSKQIKRSDNNG